MKKYEIGYTQGVFDMLHIGHINLLNNAKLQCEKLIVGVNGDDLVFNYKKKIPVMSEEERRSIVGNLKAVDEAIIVRSLEKMQIFKTKKFNAIFIGDDWKGNERWKETEIDLAEVGAEVVYLPHTDGISSSLLSLVVKECIQE